MRMCTSGSAGKPRPTSRLEWSFLLSCLFESVNNPADPTHREPNPHREKRSLASGGAGSGTCDGADPGLFVHAVLRCAGGLELRLLLSLQAPRDSRRSAVDLHGRAVL